MKNLESYFDLFYYDKSSVSGLRYKRDIVGKNGRIYKKRNDVTGSVKVRSESKLELPKAWVVYVNGKRVYVHNIILTLNSIPFNENQDVDHIDGNPLNNLLENLRVVEHNINSRNCKKSNNNVSGVNGVALLRRKDGRPDTYCATWTELDGTKKTKEFSTFKYGYEKALELAKKYREKQISRLNSEGAGYSNRHGL